MTKDELMEVEIQERKKMLSGSTNSQRRAFCNAVITNLLVSSLFIGYFVYTFLAHYMKLEVLHSI